MYALEKAALDDPFLADALEGFEQSSTDLTQDMQDLKARLDLRTSQKEHKVVPLLPDRKSWWKAAAAIILVAGGALTTYQILLKPPTQSVAKHEQASKPATAAQDNASVIDTTLIADVAESKTPGETAPSAKRSQQHSAPAKPVIASNETAATVSSYKTAESGFIAAEESARINKKELDEAKALKAVPPKQQPEGYALKKKNRQASEKMVAESFQGKVSGVDVIVTAVSSDTENVFPVIGWAAYHHYLRDSVKIERKSSNIDLEEVVVHADQADHITQKQKQTTKKSVVVSFVVNSSGQLQKFRIKKSAGKLYDDEAIRLIRSGPEWKTKSGKKTRADITIHFN